MKKLLEITQCRQCKHLWIWGRECRLSENRRVDDYGEIPDWCRLADSDQKEKEETK
jgi:hypothetical protein